MKTLGPQLEAAEQRMMLARKTAFSLGRPKVAPVGPKLDKGEPTPAPVVPKLDKNGPTLTPAVPKLDKDGSGPVPQQPSAVPLQPSIGPQGVGAQGKKTDKDR
jgi:hypothetical protein